MNPRSPSLRTISYGNDLVLSRCSATGATSCSAKSRTVRRISSWSGERSKSMTTHSITVNLGAVADGSIAPAIRVIVEHGARRRPELAREDGRIRLRFTEGWPSVLIVLGERLIVCDNEDAPADVEVTASLPDLVALLNTPLRGGIPNPVRREGHSAIGLLRGGVAITGARTTGRRLLRLLSLLD